MTSSRLGCMVLSETSARNCVLPFSLKSSSKNLSSSTASLTTIRQGQGSHSFISRRLRGPIRPTAEHERATKTSRHGARKRFSLESRLHRHRRRRLPSSHPSLQRSIHCPLYIAVEMSSEQPWRGAPVTDHGCWSELVSDQGGASPCSLAGCDILEYYIN